VTLPPVDPPAGDPTPGDATPGDPTPPPPAPGGPTRSGGPQYPPPTYPVYSPPTYSAYPQPYPQPVPGLGRPRNTGLGALIASFLSLCGIAWIVSVVLAIYTLVASRPGVDRGRRKAIVALCIDGVVLVVWIGLAVYALTSTPDRDANGAITESGSVGVFSLKVGDCLGAPSDLSPGERTTRRRVDVVPCSSPHTGEVFAVLPLSSTSFPGADTARREAARLCSDESAKYVMAAGLDTDDLQLEYLFPQSAAAWKVSHHQVTCSVLLTSGTTTEPLMTPRAPASS
jgi:hypothetical protein